MAAIIHLDQPSSKARTGRPLPDGNYKAGDDGCGPVHVRVETHGGRGGDPSYAGGWIEGHTGHKGSMLSAAQMRRLADALNAAAQTIEESGIPSFQETRSR